METIWSPNKYEGRNKPIRLIVEHTMEASEAGDTAENVARYFSRSYKDGGPQASAHICSDNNSDVRCVPDDDTAWCAPGANADGLQHEMAGYASQGSDDWQDAYSQAMLKRVAKIQAGWAQKYDIPIRHLTIAQVRDGKTKGFCSHDDVSKAFGKSSHWDPGPDFPWSQFLDMVREFAGEPTKNDGGSGGSSSGKLSVDGKHGKSTTTALQKDLTEKGYYDGLIDGEVWSQSNTWEDDNPGLTTGWGWVSDADGSLTMKAWQRFLNEVMDATLKVDGKVGPKTNRLEQRYLKKFGTYDGAVDGEFWYPSTAKKALQKMLNSKGGLNR